MKPSTIATDEKRVLRSHDEYGPVKSDLTNYFPNYEDILYGDACEPDVVSIHTPLFIRDRALPSRNLTIRNPPPSKTTAATAHVPHQIQPRKIKSKSSPTLPKKSGRELNGFKRLDFSAVAKKGAASMPGDPLGEIVFTKSHRRAERREKNLRNIEKEHAMHEKFHLESLLERMRGPDWLKTMGVTAITDTEKKHYEPKRQYLIKGIVALIRKFAIWKEREKEMKLRTATEANGSANAGEDQNGETDEGECNEPPLEVDDSDLPDEDADASAAQQLQLEAQLRTQRLAQSTAAAVPDTKPFTSFFDKPHLRQAALGSRRRGRVVNAFGRPIPERHEIQYFSLPKEYTTEEALIANARKRRRLKRETREGT